MRQMEKIIRPKVGLLEPAKQLGNVSQACKIMGYSRDSFYRFKELYEKGGELALQDMTRRRPNLKNRIAPEVEQSVVEMALKQPAWGQVRVSNKLRKRGLSISPAGVRCVWQRNELHNMKLRLKALEAKVAQEGVILPELRSRRLRRRRATRRLTGSFRASIRATPGPRIRSTWATEECWAHLSADLYRHVLEGCDGEAVRP